MTAGTISFSTGEDPLRATKLNSAFAERVLLAGDTMTGPLLLSRAPVVPTEATTKNYVDGLVTTQLTGFLSTTGGTLTGFLTLNANPVNPLHAATKQYVDNSSFLPLTGGTLTGLLTAGLNGGGGAEIRINSAAGTTRYLSYATAGQMRWRVYATATAEGGSNAGSDYVIDRFNDAGTLLGTSFTIARNTGIALFAASPTAPTPTLGDSSTKLATTAFVAGQIVAAGAITEAPTDGAIYGRVSSSWTPVLSLAGSAGNVGRNLLHNSLFNIAQRGIGPFTTSGAYTVDRWVPFMGGAGDSISIQAVAIPDAERSQIGDEAANFELFSAFVGGASAANAVLFVQFIENIRRLSGKTVTVSFWAVGLSGATKLGVSLDQVFGTGGSPSATVSGNGQSVTLTTTWTRYSVTLAVPSAIGKTFGTNADSKTQLNFWYSAGSNSATRSGNVGVQSGTIILWGVQLEVGSVATPLEKPDPQQDLAKCQRFYQTFSVAWWGYQATGASLGYTLALLVTMRANPTCTFANVGNNNIGTITAAPLSPASAYCLGNATATGATIINGTFTASADL